MRLIRIGLANINTTVGAFRSNVDALIGHARRMVTTCEVAGAVGRHIEVVRGRGRQRSEGGQVDLQGAAPAVAHDHLVRRQRHRRRAKV